MREGEKHGFGRWIIAYEYSGIGYFKHDRMHGNIFRIKDDGVVIDKLSGCYENGKRKGGFSKAGYKEFYAEDCVANGRFWIYQLYQILFLV